MRDHLLPPRDIGILLSMVPGMPQVYAERFLAIRTWSELHAAHEELVDYCRAERIPLVM